MPDLRPVRRFALAVFSMIFPVLGFAQSLPNNPLQWYSNETRVAAERAIADEEGTPQERAALAEQVLADREQQSGRPFDPAIRAIIFASLANKSAAALQSMTLHPTPLNVGDTSADLSFTPLTPCRIIDTRVAGGAIAAGSTRNFVVAGTAGFAAQGGTSTGCGVPVGATSVLINFTAVNPQGVGNLKGSAFPSAIPATGSIVNYQALTPALNIANGLAFPICDPSVTTCTSDMTLLANVSGTDVVADVLGYFSRFKKEQVRSFTVSSFTPPSTALTGACAIVGASVTVNAPVAGTVHVHAMVFLQVFHTAAAGNSTQWDLMISTNATCSGNYGYNRLAFLETVAANSFFYRSMPLDLTQSVAAGSSTTWSINGSAVGTIVTGETATVYGSSMSATFSPD